MSQIISTYPIFEGSQVLTSTQLNQLTSYLDQQGRLTRSKLIGIGIVCGMQVQPFPQGLQITKGLGITSEGFLIQSGNFKATHYRPYTLPEGVEYKPFKDVGHEVSLFELLTEVPTDNTGVKKLINPANFLNNKYVLIFLEIFDKDLKSCLGNACDDRGQDRLLTLRRLVISGEDLDKVLTKSSNVRSPFSNAFDLPEFHSKKPLFYPNNPESNDYHSFVKFHQNLISENFNEEFAEVLALTYKIFEPILSKSYGFVNPLESSEITEKISAIKSLVESDPVEIQGIQYLWDFSREIIQAYMEFRETALELWYTCPTDNSLFPLHLMLGRALTSSETEAQFLKYRHGFIQPPIFNQQQLLAETCIQRHRRMILLLEKLEIGIFKSEEFEKFPIKITPSIEKLGALGQRALPYYYEIKSKSALSKWYTLEESWMDPGNFQLVNSFHTGVQSYDNQPDEESIEAKNILETPLFYDLEKFPFFRIEGHLNKSLDATLSQLRKQILQFNLPIHVDVLYLGEAEESKLIENCGWNDLQEEYSYQRKIVVGFIEGLKQVFDYATEYAEKNDEEDFTTDEFYQKAVEALEMLIDMSISLAECLKDLDWVAFQNTYKKLLQYIIDFILIQQKLLEEIKLDPTKENELEFFNGLMMRLSPFVYQVLDLLFFAKLQRIYASYQSRIKLLIQSNQFSNYLKKHPGLNHEAGTLKAGTFFLLHDTKKERIIGDFSLPYYCCDSSPCLEPCWDNSIVLPPFARPDYAIAYTEKASKLEITINDFLSPGRNYEVLLVGNSSAQNGKVKKIGASNSIQYISAKGFTGIDSFQYILRDTESRQSDQGKVSILVKGPEGCYSIEILTCWGIGFVRQTLDDRKIENANESDSKAIDLLLQNLTKSKGFSLEELRSGVLEEDESRLKLLECLGIPNTGLTWEQVEQTILDHQAKNCGGVTTPECTSMEIRGNVTSSDGNAIPEVRISIKGFDAETFTNGKGNYKIQFPSPGQTVTFEFEGYDTQEVYVCSQTTVNVILNPSPKPAIGCYSTEIISRWQENFIRAMARNRQLANPSGNLPVVVNNLLGSLRSSAGFTSTELRETIANSEEAQKMILASIGIDPFGIDPKQFADRIEEYQGINCGFRRVKVGFVPAESLSAEEMKVILEANKVSYLATADKTVLEETYKAAIPGSRLTAKDLSLLKKETLTKILKDQAIPTATSDNKSVLIEKILKR